MTSILLSPHDDDSALFAAFTCMREKPIVVVIADSYIQPGRGEVGCSAEERAEETRRAHELLGCEVIRLGLRDDDLTEDAITAALPTLVSDAPPDFIYTPALEGGHPHHDLTTMAARRVFGSKRLSCYSTYAHHSQYGAADLSPVGTQEIVPTVDELALKHLALRCYESQLRINLPHFQAVVANRSEWLSGVDRIHLGCGENVKPGWMNLDAVPSNGVRHCDISRGFLPTGENSVDYVFSEDFLEHLPPERRVHVINEIWRVLVPGGVMEHFVPNAGSRNDFGSPSHLSHWNLQTFEHFDVASHRWAKDRKFEGFIGGFTLVSAELLSWAEEKDVLVERNPGATDPYRSRYMKAQSIRVRYRAVKPIEGAPDPGPKYDLF